MLKAFLGAPLALLGACATLVNGTSQTVTVSTTPPAASCTLDRMGARVGAISATPGSVHLDKSKNDLSVTCSKEGFQTASVAHASSFSGATFGNIIAGGVIGVIVDAASGANYSYPADIRPISGSIWRPTRCRSCRPWHPSPGSPVLIQQSVLARWRPDLTSCRP